MISVQRSLLPCMKREAMAEEKTRTIYSTSERRQRIVGPNCFGG